MDVANLAAFASYIMITIPCGHSVQYKSSGHDRALKAGGSTVHYCSSKCLLSTDSMALSHCEHT